jgi:hypothetical protein
LTNDKLEATLKKDFVGFIGGGNFYLLAKEEDNMVMTTSEGDLVHPKQAATEPKTKIVWSVASVETAETEADGNGEQKWHVVMDSDLCAGGEV